MQYQNQTAIHKEKKRKIKGLKENIKKAFNYKMMK